MFLVFLVNMAWTRQPTGQRQRSWAQWGWRTGCIVGTYPFLYLLNHLSMRHLFYIHLDMAPISVAHLLKSSSTLLYPTHRASTQEQRRENSVLSSSTRIRILRLHSTSRRYPPASISSDTLVVVLVWQSGRWGFNFLSVSCFLISFSTRLQSHWKHLTILLSRRTLPCSSNSNR